MDIEFINYTIDHDDIYKYISAYQNYFITNNYIDNFNSLKNPIHSAMKMSQRLKGLNMRILK